MSLINQNVINTLHLSFLSIDQRKVRNEWNCKSISSTFTRLYLVLDGTGELVHSNQEFILKPNNLYLIPSYIFCNYNTDSFLDHYYIHFIPQFAAGLSVYDMFEFNYEIPASDNDIELIKKLIKLNPGKKLKELNPTKYHKDDITPRKTDISSTEKITSHIETSGILLQLLSHFIKSAKGNDKIEDFSHYKAKITKAVNYICQNLDKTFDIKELSEISCCSPDYFTRMFVKVMGTTPIDFINSKKIEAAKIQLISSNDPIEKISLEIGLNNFPYFNRLFKKYALCTPGEYRKLYQAV